MLPSSYIPYCGSPPVPTVIWARWNLDPVLLVGLAALAVLYAVGARDRIEPRRRGAFAVGWTIAALCLVSPLCNLTVALFSARVGQHMILLLMAAPLVALGRADLAWSRALPSGLRGRLGRALPLRALASGPGAALLFTVLLWGWHVPALYDATLRGDAAYWAMHLSLFASGVLLWRRLLPDEPERMLTSVGLGFGTAVQMSVLGAILTLSPEPWYASHLATSWPWGLSALADQQLGGVIMWVPGGTVFVFSGLASVAALLRHLEAQQRGAPG